MSKNTLFIASSPLQLLNCIEAIYYFNTKNNVLLLLHTKDEIVLSQMKQLLFFVNWKEVVYILLPQKTIDKLLFAKRINSLLYKFPKDKIEQVFVGEYKSNHVNHIVNYFKNNKVCLVDDGLSLLGYDIYTQENRNKDKFVKLIYSFLFYKLNRIEYTFFTIFNIMQPSVIKNNYNFFKKYIEEKESKELVYFIGQPLVELSMVNQEKYRYELNKILNFYKHMEFIYILHRREKEEFIKQLSNELNFEYRRFENLIELEMIYSENIASDFATFYSTAIMTLPHFFENSTYHAFKIEDSSFTDKDSHFLNLNNCYIEFSKNNIKVKEL